MRRAVALPMGLDPAGRLRAGRRTHYLDTAYAAAVAEAGALPLCVGLDADPREVAGRGDGLLIPGGDDFPPDAPYPPEVRFDPVPPEQLAFDAALLAAALERGLPVLGLCYGMQLLARHHGGQLLYDIAHDRPATQEHRLGPATRHAIEIGEGTRLAALLGAGPCEVNSRHHQGVAEPGAGLRVSARASDGVIEAIEGDGAGFVLGVQWHPEDLAADHRAALFGGFVSACG